jgi:PAS domain S-box-containing protein
MDGSTPTTILGAFILGFCTLLALVVWMVRKLLDKTIPDMLTMFERVGAEDRKLYREQVKEERADCDRRAEAIRETMQHAHAEQLDALRGQQQGRAEAMAMLRAIHQTLVQSTGLAAVVTQADDAIWTKTIDGVVKSWNRAAHQLLGWHPGEVIGQSVYRLIPPDLHEDERQMLDRLRRGERVEHYQTERFHRDGRRIRLEVSISPVRDATGNVVSVGTIAREAP